MARNDIAHLHGVRVQRGGVAALDDVSLNLERGSLVTVVGPSGAGKSTLLNVLAGVLEPSAGTVQRPEDHGGTTRIVFQQPHLVPWRTVAENVRLGLDFAANGHRGIRPTPEALASVDALLDVLGIADLHARYPEQLSGGQAQRVAIARAVAAKPELLLLDEPFSALDPVTRADTQQWLRRIHDDRGLTTVLVTHDLAEAARLGDRVLVLRPGVAGVEVLEAVDGDHVTLEAELLSRFADDRDVVAAQTATKKPGRREFLTLLGAGALVALPALAGGVVRSAAEPAAASTLPSEVTPATVRIGYLPITDAAPLLIAHDQGEFADRGIDTPEPTLFRGWAPLVEALQAGTVDVVHLLMPLAMQLRYEASAPVNVLAWNHVNGSALTVRPEINDVESLAGSTVAVPGWFSIHNVVLQQLLRDAGLTAVINEAPGPDTVQLVVLAPADMPVALGNGSIAGYIVAEPFCAVAEAQGIGKILRFTGDVWREHACCVTVVRESLLTDSPDLAQRITDAVVAAQLRIRDDRAGAAARLSESGYLPQPVGAITAVLDDHDHDGYEASGAILHPEWNEDRIGFQPFAYPSYTERLVTELRLTRVDSDTAWVNALNPADVHDDLVAVDVNLQAVQSVGGLAIFGAEANRVEQVQP